MKRHGGDLESYPCENEHYGDTGQRQPVWILHPKRVVNIFEVCRAGQRAGFHRPRAGDPIEKTEPVKQNRRGEDAQKKYFAVASCE